MYFAANPEHLNQNVYNNSPKNGNLLPINFLTWNRRIGSVEKDLKLF